MTYIELQFPFTGKTLPSDHGYGLYGAISRIIPEAHSADWLTVETVPGVARGDGVTLLDQQANLKIRIPQDRVPLMLKLATPAEARRRSRVSLRRIGAIADLAAKQSRRRNDYDSHVDTKG